MTIEQSIVYTKMKTIKPLYEHQIRAEEFIKDKPYFALFMEQGTGKSRVIVDHSQYLYECNEIDCIIIISPDTVHEQWIEEQYKEHCLIDYNGYIWSGAKSQRERNLFFKLVDKHDKLLTISFPVDAFITKNINLYIKHLLENRKCFVVVDESTKIKNGRRKPIRGKRGGAIRTNTILDLFINVKHKAILTGTPSPQGPFDLWSQFEFLKQNFFGMDYFYFTHHHGIIISKKTVKGQSYKALLDDKTFNLVKNKLSKLERLDFTSINQIALQFDINTKDVMLINKMTELHSYKNLKELKEKISSITFYARKKDCLDLPAKVPEKLYCSMNSEQEKIYKQLEKNLMAEYGGRDLTVVNKMVLTLRLQMVAGGLFPYGDVSKFINKDGEEEFDIHYKYEPIKNSGKIKSLLDDLEEVYKDTSIIIWARFRGEIELIEESLNSNGYFCEKFYGGSDNSVLKRFKAGSTKILAMSPLKGAEGQNLQISTLHYFYSNGYMYDKREQAEDRSHRIGQENKVTYKDLICRGTKDELIYKILQQKKNLIDYFRTGGELF